jgi:hypothetical protein
MCPPGFVTLSAPVYRRYPRAVLADAAPALPRKGAMVGARRLDTCRALAHTFCNDRYEKR